MKDTVEVRLQVPRNLHELVKDLAERDMRTTQAQYLYLLWGVLDRLNFKPAPKKDDYNGPG